MLKEVASTSSTMSHCNEDLVGTPTSPHLLDSTPQALLDQTRTCMPGRSLLNFFKKVLVLVLQRQPPGTASKVCTLCPNAGEVRACTQGPYECIGAQGSKSIPIERSLLALLGPAAASFQQATLVRISRQQGSHVHSNLLPGSEGSCAKEALRAVSVQSMHDRERIAPCDARRGS